MLTNAHTILSRYYLYRLNVWDNTVMPVLEYAGGLRFYYCWCVANSVKQI